MDDSLLPSVASLEDDTFEDDDDGAETMTAAQVLSKLEEAWLNEKFAPELLPHCSEIVDCMLEQLQEMQRNIDRGRKADLKVNIHKMEIDRIRFILSSYLRERLKKIECFAENILEREKQLGTQLLTDDERNYATAYHGLAVSHFKSVALKHLPLNVQGLDPKKTAVSPNIDSYIFIKLLKDVSGVVVEEETVDTGEEIIDMHSGDQHIMRYKPVAALVTSGDAVLI